MYAVSYALLDGEPPRDAALAIVKEVLGALEVEPLSLWWTKMNGQQARERAFRWERVLEVADQAATVMAYGIKRSKAHFFLSAALRHGVRAANPTRSAPPALSLRVQMGERVPEERAVAAGQLLLRQSAASLPVLSGGLTCFTDGDVASAEIMFVSVHRPEQPEPVRRRQSIDQSYEGRLWKRARRIYWLTLLGPRLAQELGGAAGARIAGAASVEEIAGSLLVHAGGPFEPDDAPSFRARAAGLRGWLWPRSIQNPVDQPELT